MPQTVSRRLLTAEFRVRERIMSFGLREAKFWHFTGFSPGTFHTPVSTFTHALYTHIMTTVDATQFMFLHRL